MNIICKNDIDQLDDIDALVIFVKNDFDINALNQTFSFDKYEFNSLKKITEQQNFSGKNLQTLFLPLPLSKYNAIYLIGLGKDIKLNSFRNLWGRKWIALRNNHSQKIILYGLDKQEFLAASEVLILALYEFRNYQTGKQEQHIIKELTLFTKINQLEIDRIKTQCHFSNWARDLINTPARDLTPSHLAKIVTKLAHKFNLPHLVLGEKEIKKLGMGALQAVSLGSAQEAKFIILQYNLDQNYKHIALIGKGVTFDSGGLSLKPSNFMASMKTDMSGAATVLGAFFSLIQLKPKVTLSCVIPATENMIDGQSMKLGDIITAYNGKTIEINNSDAEGRLILADALAYTEKEINPDIIIDVATLTGAVKIALGHQHAGIITRDDALASQLIGTGEKVNELLWRLPLTDYHQDLMKGKNADLSNIASKSVAGTSAAGAFLENFVEKTPWVHLDIANVARECQLPYLSHHGSTGFGVRLLSQWILDSTN